MVRSFIDIDRIHENKRVTCTPRSRPLVPLNKIKNAIRDIESLVNVERLPEADLIRFFEKTSNILEYLMNDLVFRPNTPTDDSIFIGEPVHESDSMLILFYSNSSGGKKEEKGVGYT